MLTRSTIRCRPVVLAIILLLLAKQSHASQSGQTNFAPTPITPTAGTGMPAEVLASQTVGGVGAPPGAFGVTPNASPVPFNPYTGNVSRAVTDLQIPTIGEIGLNFSRYFHSRVTLDDRNNNVLVGSQVFGSGGNWRHNFEWDFLIQAHDNNNPSNPTDIRIVYPDGSICDFYNNSTLNTGSALPAGASLAPNISATLYRPILGSADTDFIYLRPGGSNSQYILVRSNNDAYIFSPVPVNTPVTTPAQNPYYLSNIVDSQGNITILTWSLIASTYWEPITITAPNGAFMQLSYTVYSFENSKFPLLTKISGTSIPGAGISFYYTASTATSTKVQYESLTQVGYNQNLLDQTAPSGSYALNAFYSYALPVNEAAGSAIYPEMIAAQDLYSKGPKSVYFAYAANDAYQCGTATGIYDYMAARPGYRVSPPLSLVSSSPHVLQWEGADPQPPSAVQCGTIYYSSTNQGNTNEYLYTVDSQGRITQIVDNPNGIDVTSSISYSANPSNGNVTTKTLDATPQHNQTSTVRSQAGKLLSITYPPTGSESAGPSETWTYTPLDANNYSYLQTHVNCPTTANNGQGCITQFAYQSPRTSTYPLPQLISSIAYASGTTLATSESFSYGSVASSPSTSVVVTQHNNRNGSTEYYSYSSIGALSSTTDGAGDVTSYTYDFLTREPETMVNGNHTQFNYTYGNVIPSNLASGSYVITSVNNVPYSGTVVIYNELGQLIETTDRLSNPTTFTYDDVGRLQSVTGPVAGPGASGGVQTVTYSYTFPNNGSSPDTVTYSSGITESATNEMLWGFRPLSVVSDNANKPDPSAVRFGYDNMGNVTSITDPLTRVTQIQYDGRNRKTQVTDPLLNNTNYYYDDNSCLTKQTSPTAVVTNSYDVMNRLSQCSITGVAGSTYRSTTNYAYDQEDHLQYYYDPDNDVSNNTAYYYQYDGDERLTSARYPDGSSEKYAYDGLGNVLTLTSRDGRVKTSTYSWFNAPNTIQWSLPNGSPDPNTPPTTCTYDGDNRLSAISNSNATIKCSYNNYGSPLSVTQSFLSWQKGSSLQPVLYTYSPGDNTVATVKYPGSTQLTYGYGGRDELESIAQGTGTLVTYGYNAANCTSKILGNGVVSAYGYDSQERLTSVVDTTGTATLQSFNYGYDSGSRCSYVQRANGLGDVYGYDASNQLTQVQYNANTPLATPSDWTRQVNYTFDLAGNRSLLTDSSFSGGTLTSTTTSTYTLSTNQLNQYSAVGVTTGTNTTTVPVAYNTGTMTLNTGFLNSYGNWEYAYDAYGHLIKAVNSSTLAESDFEYDPLGRCVASYASPTSGSGTTTYYVYGQDWSVLEEFSASGKFPTNLTSSSLSESQRYVTGGSIDEIITRTSNPTGSASTIYYNYDGSGNVTMLTSSSGTISVLERYTYDIYGMPTITNGSGATLGSSAYGNRYLFSGREYDSTSSLYRYRNRDFLPALGRFLQPDPIGHAGDGYNLYRFCQNDPVNSRDPYGLAPTDEPPIVVTPPSLTAWEQEVLRQQLDGEAPGGDASEGYHPYGPVIALPAIIVTPPATLPTADDPSAVDDNTYNPLFAGMHSLPYEDPIVEYDFGIAYLGTNYVIKGGIGLSLAPFLSELGGLFQTARAAEGPVDTFWAGEEAGVYARASGGTVLNLSEDATSEEILSASLNAARNASGDINVFQSASGVSLESTFVPEGQILINNPNVTSITYNIIMEDGSITQIFVPK